MKRRTFVKSLAGAVAAGISRTAHAAETVAVPSYLKNHADLFARDPHAAALAWFKEARFGLFMHYGLYSILGRGEWVMFHEAIPVAEYEKLKDQFRPDKFDADLITDLAADGRHALREHHLAPPRQLLPVRVEAFGLHQRRTARPSATWSANWPSSAGRRGWACSSTIPTRSTGGIPISIRASSIPSPVRTTSSPSRATSGRKDEDFARYIEFVHGQLQELLTNYGPLAGHLVRPDHGLLRAARPVPDPRDLRDDPPAPAANAASVSSRARPARRISPRRNAAASRWPSGSASSTATRKAKIADDAWEREQVEAQRDLRHAPAAHLGLQAGRRRQAPRRRRNAAAGWRGLRTELQSAHEHRAAAGRLDSSSRREDATRGRPAHPRRGWPAPVASEPPAAPPKAKKDKAAAPTE